jgi:hypothetical protein
VLPAAGIVYERLGQLIAELGKFPLCQRVARQKGQAATLFELPLKLAKIAVFTHRRTPFY